jgi:hypothetical protein
MTSIFRTISDTRYVTYFIIILSSMLLSSCGGSKIKYSGYLNDYSKLQPYGSGTRWISSDTDFSKYKKIIIDPVTFYVGASLDGQPVKTNPDNINKITDYFHAALVKELSEVLEVVERPGPDVIRARAAITSMEVQSGDLKAYQYVPVMLVATGAAEVAGMRDKFAIVSMEGELLDSLTGRRIAASVQSSSKETTIKDVDSLTPQDIKNILDHWADDARLSFIREQ